MSGNKGVCFCHNVMLFIIINLFDKWIHLISHILCKLFSILYHYKKQLIRSQPTLAGVSNAVAYPIFVIFGVLVYL